MPIGYPPDPLTKNGSTIEKASGLPEEIREVFNATDLASATIEKIVYELARLKNWEPKNDSEKLQKEKKVELLKKDALGFFKAELKEKKRALGVSKRPKTKTKRDMDTIARLEQKDIPELEIIIADLEKNLRAKESAEAPAPTAEEPVLTVDESVNEEMPAVADTAVPITPAMTTAEAILEPKAVPEPVSETKSGKKTPETRSTNSRLEEILGAAWTKVRVAKLASLDEPTRSLVRGLVAKRLEELRREEKEKGASNPMLDAVKANCSRILNHIKEIEDTARIKQHADILEAVTQILEQKPQAKSAGPETPSLVDQLNAFETATQSCFQILARMRDTISQYGDMDDAQFAMTMRWAQNDLVNAREVLFKFKDLPSFTGDMDRLDQEIRAVHEAWEKAASSPENKLRRVLKEAASQLQANRAREAEIRARLAEIEGMGLGNKLKKGLRGILKK